MSQHKLSAAFKCSCFAKKKSLFLIVLVFGLLGYILWILKWNQRFDDREQVSFRLPYRYQKNVFPESELVVTYIHQPQHLVSTEEKKNFVTFFVKSAPRNFKRRKIIRQTWGLYSSLDNLNFTVIFLIGSVSNKFQNKINLESECFDDILQTTFDDTFRNLTIKTLSAFKWITQKMAKKSMFYVISDDDCVINLMETVKFLQTKVENGKPIDNRIYCGFQYESINGVIRGKHRLSTSWSQYPALRYPSFCRGVMVILTFPMIVDIYEMSKVTNYTGFPLEDVMVYGILRHKLGHNGKDISAVINGGHPIMFYPWDNNNKSLLIKMKRMWKLWLPEMLNVTTVIKRNMTDKTCPDYFLPAG
ncbi:unnamed protein product [Clavelina lepadiformis]|uniref:Hexosyltransferase n=1 Tax=Clavelina lepadiformis TaxID=159417 RepID=A0ABP0G7I1_CLALP